MEKSNLTGIEFYNTINSKNPELEKNIKINQVQSKNIISIFKITKLALTPYQVHTIYKRYVGNILITSVRRSISNLTRLGVLTKLDKKIIEQYNSENYLWKLS